MAKALIICEKPSLAKNVLMALDPGYPKDRKYVYHHDDGYYEGDSYLISYCFGHLFELYSIDDYKYGPRHKKDQKDPWTVKTLPFIPDHFEYYYKRNKGAVDSGVRKQFLNLKKLINRSDVDRIVHCGDADREGELIVRNVLDQAHCRKPVYRLWLPEQTPKGILTGLQSMKPDRDYDLLAEEGKARTYVDWLYGINLTRYATLCVGEYGKLIRVGRVVVPIVKAIYDQDMEIRNFHSTPFYTSVHHGEWQGVSYSLATKDHLPDREIADRQTERLNASGPLTVTDVSTKTVTSSPPRLFSLSKLQGQLSKKYKMSLKTSMGLIQGLYEKGYLSYPRTNTEYLAEEEKDKAREIIAMLQKHGCSVAFRDGKQIFDDSKIESHSALIPTYKYPSSLSEDEQKVYDTVKNRFCAVFCAEDCILKKTKVTFRAGDGTSFSLSGTVIQQKGYLQYDGNTKGKEIPPFAKGQKIEPEFRTEEGKTTPPPHYSTEALMNFLKNPYKEEKASGPEEDDTMSEEDYKAMFEGVEIGTEATRTGIIDHAKQSKYIAEKKGVFTILPDGENLIHTLDRLGIDLYKTKSVELSKLLKEVGHGEKSVQDVVELTRRELNRDIDPDKVPVKSTFRKETNTMAEKIGVCPLCGKDVYQNDFKVYCSDSHWKNGAVTGCPFQFFRTVGPRDNRTTLTDENIQDIIDTERTTQKVTLHKKDDPSKTYQCYLKFDRKENRLVFDFSD